MAASKLRRARFAPDQDVAFQKYLDETGRSEAEVIRDAVMIHIKRRDLVGKMAAPGRPKKKPASKR